MLLLIIILLLYNISVTINHYYNNHIEYYHSCHYYMFIIRCTIVLLYNCNYQSLPYYYIITITLFLQLDPPIRPWRCRCRYCPPFLLAFLRRSRAAAGHVLADAEYETLAELLVSESGNRNLEPWPMDLVGQNPRDWSLYSSHHIAII